MVERVFLAFIADIGAPMRIVAIDKKSAHEQAQAAHPGWAIEVYSQSELLDLEIVQREMRKAISWLELVLASVDEITDRQLALTRIESARSCLDTMMDHFAEGTVA